MSLTLTTSHQNRNSKSAVLAPVAVCTTSDSWIPVATPLGSIGTLVIGGRWLLNRMFQILARARAKEIMTAAALLVVLGAAPDIEPFPGLLLGLFFLGVGMSLDFSVVSANAGLIIAGVVALMTTKATCIYLVARAPGSDIGEAVDRTVFMAQGGEFAFVLSAAAATPAVISPAINANMTAIVVVSIALTPIVSIGHKRWGAVLAAGATEVEADATMDFVRRRDAQRLDLQSVGGKFAGRELLQGTQKSIQRAAEEGQA